MKRVCDHHPIQFKILLTHTFLYFRESHLWKYSSKTTNQNISNEHNNINYGTHTHWLMLQRNTLHHQLQVHHKADTSVSNNNSGVWCRPVHDDVIKWKHFPRYWPFLRGIHRSPVNSPYKGQWRGALIFSLICVWINGWVNNREAGDLRRYRSHYDVSVMFKH